MKNHLASKVSNDITAYTRIDITTELEKPLLILIEFTELLLNNYQAKDQVLFHKISLFIAFYC